MFVTSMRLAESGSSPVDRSDQRLVGATDPLGCRQGSLVKSLDQGPRVRRVKRRLSFRRSAAVDVVRKIAPYAPLIRIALTELLRWLYGHFDDNPPNRLR